ncbi:hypothetical protein ACROYT_G001255 [Oculina patagonica]
MPVDSTSDAAIKQTEEYARSIVADAIPAALAPRQVERESEQDPTLQLVRHVITSGDWSNLQGTTYKAVRDELWIIYIYSKKHDGEESRWRRPRISEGLRSVSQILRGPKGKQKRAVQIKGVKEKPFQFALLSCKDDDAEDDVCPFLKKDIHNNNDKSFI